METGERLKEGKLRVRDLIGDFDEEDPDFDETSLTEQAIKLIDRIRRLDRDQVKIREKLSDKSLREARRCKLHDSLRTNQQEILDLLSVLQIGSKH